MLRSGFHYFIGTWYHHTGNKRIGLNVIVAFPKRCALVGLRVGMVVGVVIEETRHGLKTTHWTDRPPHRAPAVFRLF